MLRNLSAEAPEVPADPPGRILVCSTRSGGPDCSAMKMSGSPSLYYAHRDHLDSELYAEAFCGLDRYIYRVFF